MSLSSEFRKILIVLYQKQEGIDIYQLNSVLLFSPGIISQAVIWLCENGLGSTNGDMLKLTETGRIWIVANRSKLFGNVDRIWTKSQAVGEPSVAIGQPYLPDLNQIDREFFLLGS